MRHFCALIFVMASLPFSATGQPDRAAGLKTAFTRVQHLRRGINASGWFAQSQDYSANHTDRYTDAQDIDLIAKLGFDFVRLSVDAAPLEQAPQAADGLNAEFVERVDRVVDTILSDGLAVVFDLQPEDTYKAQLRNSADGSKSLILLWRKLATHYQTRDPDRVFFEIINEPELSNAKRWAEIQEQVAATIRQAAPAHTIIATGPNYSDIPDLLTTHPLADGNIIYNFHFYDPHEFTHQGANWGVPWWFDTHSIPYPPTESSMEELIKEVPQGPDRYALENYWLDSWNARHIKLLIDEAAGWAHDNHVPLICDEFGAYREHSDPASRANWIGDARIALESAGIGWAMWDYRGGFGLVTKQDGQPAQVDDSVVKALGLKTP